MLLADSTSPEEVERALEDGDEELAIDIEEQRRHADREPVALVRRALPTPVRTR
jgi:hypothetical protein